jgi:amino acid adenylation domain-containing protein
MMNRQISFEKSVVASQYSKEKAYWLSKLSGELEKTRFLTDFRDGNEKGKETRIGKFFMKKVTVPWTGELFTKLMVLVSGDDKLLHITLAAGLTLLLYKYNGSSDVIIGTPIYRQDMEGDFINTVLLLRTHPNAVVTFKELLVQMKQTIQEANEHLNYPIETLWQKVKPNGSIFKEECPFFDVALLLENIHDRRYLQSVKPNIIFSFLRADHSIETTLEYNSFIYSKATSERIIHHFISLLKEALGSLEKPVSHLEILSQEEKRTILYDFNQSCMDYTLAATIQELFESQVERTPDTTAVVFDDLQVTYRVLNQRVNRLAWKLKWKGIKPDYIVGLMVERSLEMVEGILGILKAGGAYLPIDVKLPGKRVVSLLKDCQVTVLCTTSSIIQRLSFTALQDSRFDKVKLHITAPRPQVKNLDALPLVNRSLVNFEKYHHYIGVAPFKYTISMQGSRGCPFNCAYCHKIWPKTHIIRSAEKLFAEVRTYYYMGVRRFVFLDDVFNLNVKNSSRFLNLVIENGLDIHLSLILRGDILSRDYIDLMVKAGTKRMALALETASPRLQKMIGKNLNLRKFQENIEYICEKHPQVILELNTMLGFPTETEEEALMTLDFIMGLKWTHFPYVHILKIYPNTDMEKLALDNGISPSAITNSLNLAYHELPETMSFDKNFTVEYQTRFLNDYFLSKERLMHVLPHQMRILTEDEMVQKYHSYLPFEITRLSTLLEFVGISKEEVDPEACLSEDSIAVSDFNEKLRQHFNIHSPGFSTKQVPGNEDVLRILLLDVSQYFSGENDMLYNVVEAPLGLMYLLTYINERFGIKVKGKIAKSRIDFDSFEELKALLQDFKPDVIGMRTLTFYKDYFHETAAMIRQWGIEVPIIAGGPYATSDYKKILQDRNIDLVVLGEGEITFSELIQRFIENEKKMPSQEVLKHIAGIAFVPDRQKHWSDFDREIIMMDIMETGRESPDNPGTINHPNHLAYIMFTSGSTGKPKGVMIEHRNVVNVVNWFSHQYALQKGTRILQMSAYTFDPSVNQIIGPLISGATLYMVNRNLLADIQGLRQYIDKHQIHVVNFVPMMLRDLLADDHKLESLRVVLSGGEKLDDATKDLIIEKGYELYNQYGPIETTIDALVSKCSKEKVTLGKPIANVQCYILDEFNHLMPIGVTGEICITGAGVGRGYLGKPGLTEKKFIPNPFDQGGRMYKTGDHARWLPDGTVEFLGRKDYQVKINGIRIEPEEIEKHLLAFGGIKEAVVMARENQNNDKYLCVFFTAQKEFSDVELREYLRKELPDHMVPSHFFQLGELPLTPHGKVDRKALLETIVETGIVPKTGELPGNQLEMKLAEIWADILGIKNTKIGIDASFFDMGGNSLEATRLLLRIYKNFHVKIPLTKVFQTPTIRGLSEIIKETSSKKFSSIEPVEKKEFYPLSPAQKRLFFLYQMEKDSINYNIPQIVIMAGEMARKKLEKTFKTLISRHNSLRTSFEFATGQPVQRIHSYVDFGIFYFDVDIKESEEIDIEVSTVKASIQQVMKDFVTPFDLTRPPLLKVGLVGLGKDKHLLMVDIHHIVSDAVSMGMFVKDLFMLYEGTPLPPLKIQYNDFSEWQNDRLESGGLNTQEAYWINSFKYDIPLLELATDFPRPQKKSFIGSNVGYPFGEALTKQVKLLVKKTDTTLYMVLMAIYTILLSMYSGQQDIVVGSPITGRTHPDIENTMGIFLNMIIIRSFPAEDKSFIDFLGEIKENALNAFENQDYPYDRLVNKLELQRIPGRNPLFDVGFVLQNVHMESSPHTSSKGIEKLKISPYKYEINVSKFDLLLGVNDFEENIFMNLEYSADLFKRETVERMVERFIEILQQVITNKDIKIGDITLSHQLAVPSSTFLYEEEGSDGFGF